MSKTLIIGALGNMGRRYQAICRYLGEDYLCFDLKMDYGDWPMSIRGLDFDRVIVASPTDTHVTWIKTLAEFGKPILCEKPIAAHEDRVKECIDACAEYETPCFVVNNYAQFLMDHNPSSILYNNYYTGHDGLAWDCCQLIYIAKRLEIELSVYRESPIWILHTTHTETDLPYGICRHDLRSVHESYVDVVDQFCNGIDSKLWNLQDAYEMTKVTRYVHESLKGIQAEGFYYDPSTERVDALTFEDLQKDRGKECP